MWSYDVPGCCLEFSMRTQCVYYQSLQIQGFLQEIQSESFLSFRVACRERRTKDLLTTILGNLPNDIIMVDRSRQSRAFYSFDKPEATYSSSPGVSFRCGPYNSFLSFYCDCSSERYRSESVLSSFPISLASYPRNLTHTYA